MTDGWWRIKQHAPNHPGGFLVTEILMSATNPPLVAETVHGLAVTHKDQHNQILRIEHYPWASIVHAEYQPPTGDNQ